MINKVYCRCRAFPLASHYEFENLNNSGRVQPRRKEPSRDYIACGVVCSAGSLPCLCTIILHKHRRLCLRLLTQVLAQSLEVA